MRYSASELKSCRRHRGDILESVWLGLHVRLWLGFERVYMIGKQLLVFSFFFLPLTSPSLHLFTLLSPMQIIGLHRFLHTFTNIYKVLPILSTCSPSGRQAVGSAAWEAAANLSLGVYLLHANRTWAETLRWRQMCLMVGGCGWMQHLFYYLKLNMEKTHEDVKGFMFCQNRHNWYLFVQAQSENHRTSVWEKQCCCTVLITLGLY